jgi:hypothetical protein
MATKAVLEVPTDMEKVYRRFELAEFAPRSLADSGGVVGIRRGARSGARDGPHR